MDGPSPGHCAGVPLFYTTGNHQITVWGKDYDTEFHMNRMGSCPCRPYYSYDIKGVHFVSLPELMTAAYVTDEELAWLELDLNVHRDTTTIILSHNAIKGTTLAHDDPGTAAWQTVDACSISSPATRA